MNPIRIIQYGRERYEEIVKWSDEYDKYEEHKRKRQLRSMSVPLSVELSRRQRPF